MPNWLPHDLPASAKLGWFDFSGSTFITRSAGKFATATNRFGIAPNLGPWHPTDTTNYPNELHGRFPPTSLKAAGSSATQRMLFDTPIATGGKTITILYPWVRAGAASQASPASVFGNDSNLAIPALESGSTNTSLAIGATLLENRIDGQIVSWANRGEVYDSFQSLTPMVRSHTVTLDAGIDLTTFLASYFGAYGSTHAIPEFVIVEGQPETFDRQKIEGYFAHKYGTTASLAASHPYKTTQAQVQTWNSGDKSFEWTMFDNDRAAHQNKTYNAQAKVRATGTGYPASDPNFHEVVFTINLMVPGTFQFGIGNKVKTLNDNMGWSGNEFVVSENGQINSTNLGNVGTLAQGDRLRFRFKNSLAWVRRERGAELGNWNGNASANPDTVTGGINISFVSGDLIPQAFTNVRDQKVTINCANWDFYKSSPPPPAVSFDPVGLQVSPTVARPALTASTQLVPRSLETQPQTARPALTAATQLQPRPLQAQPVAGSPVLSASAALTGRALGLDPRTGRPVLSASTQIAPTGLLLAPVVARLGLTAATSLSPRGLRLDPVVGSPVLTAGGALQPVGISVAPAVGSPALSASTQLQPVGLGLAPVVGIPALTSSTALSPVGLHLDTSVERPVVSLPDVIGPRDTIIIRAARSEISIDRFRPEPAIARASRPGPVITSRARLALSALVSGAVGETVINGPGGNVTAFRKGSKVRIDSYYKDEEVPITIHLRDVNNVAITNAAQQEVFIVLGTTKGGDALGGVQYQFSMISEVDATFRRVLTPAELALITEGPTFYYTIWSRVPGNTPVWRDSGEIVLQESISLVS